MLAPGVDVNSATLCALVYVPGNGLYVGATTVPAEIVYVPLTTDDEKNPERIPIARIVVDADTAIAPEYNVLAEVGIEPSVV